MAVKLTPDEQRVLEALEQADPDREHQFNTFCHSLIALRLGNLETLLRALKRRGLVGQSGRGRWAQWWITQLGCSAIGAPWKP